MLPTYIELEGFKEIARMGNISRAAKRLGISQPSLSQSLQKLEERVGTPLFIRGKSGVTLTDAGRDILLKVDDLLNLWKTSVAEATRHSEELSGTLRIGCHASVAQYSLAPILKTIELEFPKVRVELAHDLSRRIADQVLHNQLDFGIVINPFPAPDLVLRSLAVDHQGIFVNNRNTKLAEVQERTLFMEPNLQQSQTILRQLYKKGIVFRRVIESASLEVCAAMLRDDVGASLLPKRVQMLVAPYATRVEGTPEYSDEIKLIYRADRIQGSAVKTFMKRMEKVLKDHLMLKDL